MALTLEYIREKGIFLGKCQGESSSRFGWHPENHSSMNEEGEAKKWTEGCTFNSSNDFPQSIKSSVEL